MDIRMKLPPSEAGAKLLKKNVIPDDFYVLYKKVSTDTDNGYLFEGLYNPANEYNENYIAVPFGSTYDGLESWTAGTIFSNVLFSSFDNSWVYYGGKSINWKDLSKALGISWCCLAERNKFYDVYTQAAYVPSPTQKKFCCSDRDDTGKIEERKVVGGHVVLGNCPKKMEKGSSVYIVPICRHHNSVSLAHITKQNRNSTPGNGNGFFMKLSCDTNVIKLKGYLEEP